MCNHQYKHFELSEKEFSCKLTQRIKSATDKLIPIDSKGLCIFHSDAITWKKENDFVYWLGQLIGTYNFEKEKPNLREIHFTAQGEKDEIDYLSFLQNAHLQGSVFYDVVSVKDMTFIGSLDFMECYFKRSLFL